MNDGANKFYKPALLGGILLLLIAVGLLQHSLNRLRTDPDLGLTRVASLDNAPPVLAFTTVALGGFRGLIANMLWVRMTDLQAEGKYFEMVQLADWITKLEPHFSAVWIHQAWNMAYNVSVKFSDPADRWRWVQQGIELLRDKALKYNPREALLYRELAWIFQHKLGQNMDNAHFYYKTEWALQMESVLGSGHPDFQTLIHPQTADASNRVERLREVYKMDPKIMQDVDAEYGPLDWRLPETHAIYWAYVGLLKSRPKNLITLRRVIYQSMALATERGTLWFVDTSEGRSIRLSPNLDLAEKANAAYEKMIRDDKEMRHAIQTAHRNFLLELVYLMYAYNRVGEANRYFAQVKKEYPDTVPPEMTAEEYALLTLTGELKSLNHDRVKAIVEGLLNQSFLSLALGEEDRTLGLRQMARRLWTYYDEKVGTQQERLGLPPFPEMVATVRDNLLAPGAWDPILAARLRTRLGLPAMTNAPPNAATNAPANAPPQE